MTKPQRKLTFYRQQLYRNNSRSCLSRIGNRYTDDQALSLSGNTLALEDGGSVNLAGYLDNTDDQALSLSGNTLALEDGGTVNLAGYLDNTDDQTATEVDITDSANNFTGTTVEAALAELATGSTDDQALSLSGNTLALEDGGTVNLAGYLDNTDDQALSLSG